MKIVKLEKDKIKVILTQSDLDNMDIDINDITPNSPEISKFLSEILRTVKEETGFTIEDSQTVVEATTFGMGVILVFSKVKKNYVKGIKAIKKDDRVAYEFFGFDDLLGLLVNVDYASILDMRLYQYMNSFFITLPKNNVPILIYEYSLKNRSSCIAESLLSEYGRFLGDGKSILAMVLELKKIN